MRIGIMTGGGDCPGLNAVIRAVVKKGTVLGHNFVGFKYGWRGLLRDETIELTPNSTGTILRQGGTILGTSRDTPFLHEGGIDAAQETFARQYLDALIVIGGDGSLSCARKMCADCGMPIVGVPKTIDNDISGTDTTFGFDTAVMIATEAIDRLQTPDGSHDRILVCEVMGRHTGWIALESGIAAGAHAILIPEEPFNLAHVTSTLKHRHASGRSFSVVVVAEGAVADENAEFQLPTREEDQFGHQRLGGIAHLIAPALEELTGFEARAAVLGPIQRGGDPTPRDRVLATRFGVGAAEAVHDRAFGQVVALHGPHIERITLDDAVGHLKSADAELRDVARVVAC